jgi:hypothetical protein
MKHHLLCSALLLGSFCFSQPRSFVFGPAFHIGSGTFENIAFTRSYSLDTEGNPVVQFSDLQTGKFGSMGAGLLGEINKPHFHMGFDLAYPLKKSFKNISGTAQHGPVFNFALAWGGYIKGKFGILAGFSMFANGSKFSPQPTSFTDNQNAATYQPTDGNMDYKASGKYYRTTYTGGGFTADLHLMYAITEKFVFRLTYSPTFSPIKEPKGSDDVNFEGKTKGSRKIESGLFYQLNENFGFFARYTNTSLKNTLYVKGIKITNSSGETSEHEVPVFPNQKLSTHAIVIGIMVPASWFGSAERGGGGTINVK